MRKSLIDFLNLFLEQVKNNNFSDAYFMISEVINKKTISKDKKNLLIRTFVSFNKYYFKKNNNYLNFNEQFINFVASKNFLELINLYKYNNFFKNINLIKYKYLLIKIFLDKNINFKNKYFFLEILKEQNVDCIFIVTDYKKSYLINPKKIFIIKNSLIYLEGKNIIYQLFYQLDKKKYKCLKDKYLIFLYDFYPNKIDKNEIKNFVLSYVLFFLKKVNKNIESEKMYKFLFLNIANVNKYINYFNQYYDN